MILKLRMDGSTAILTPHGMLLSGADADDLEQRIVELDEAGNPRLLINLSETTYMSSTGLGVLLFARARYLKRGARVKICAVEGPIRQVFNLVRMPVVFGEDLHETEEEALASFQAPAAPPRD